MTTLGDRLRQVDHTLVPTAEETYDIAPPPIPRRALTRSASVDEVASAIREDGSVRIGAYIVTHRGLAYAETPDAEEIKAFGQYLGRLDRAFAWIVADWVAGASLVYGETYREFAQWTGKREKTLRQWRWLANAVELSVRTDNSTLYHAQKVASMAVDDQRYWLNAAAHYQWSARLLERMIADHPTGLPDGFEMAQPVVSRPSLMQRFTSTFERVDHRFTKIASAASAQERYDMAQMLREMAERLERMEADEG